jgi:hypothetical protein
MCVAVKKYYYTSPFKKHGVNCMISGINTNGSGRASEDHIFGRPMCMLIVNVNIDMKTFGGYV